MKKFLSYVFTLLLALNLVGFPLVHADSGSDNSGSSHDENEIDDSGNDSASDLDDSNEDNDQDQMDDSGNDSASDLDESDEDNSDSSDDNSVTTATVDCPNPDEAIDLLEGVRAIFFARLQERNPELYEKLSERITKLIRESKMRLRELCEKNPARFQRVIQRRELLRKQRDERIELRLKQRDDRLELRLKQREDNSGRGSGMMEICHHLPTGETVTLKVSESAWKAHEGHGDTVGRCDRPEDDSSNDEDHMTGLTEAEAEVFTNETVVKLEFNDEKEIFVTDATEREAIIEDILEHIDATHDEVDAVLVVSQEDRESRPEDKE